MSKYTRVFLGQAGILFLLIFALLFWVYRLRREEGHIKRRRGLYASFSPKTIAYIVLAAVAITYFVSQFANSGLTTALLFVALLGLAPLMVNNTKKRVQQEELFADVILYCQNMGMLLKQTHNVYSSLAKTSQDLSTSLRDDLEGLRAALETGRKETVEAMVTLEKNYPYSCIRNLDVIILHMFYENANVDDALITTFQDDVTTLEQDVRNNKAKRKALRVSYIVIAIGSVVAYWWFVSNLEATFSEGFDTELYRMMNMLFVFGSLLSFFAVDRYFNHNTTKE